MKHIISMIVVAALAAVGMAEAKPEVRPEKPVCPIEMKHGKHRCHKHHVRPHRHGKRHHVRPHCKHGRHKHTDVIIIRPVRKDCPAMKHGK